MSLGCELPHLPGLSRSKTGSFSCIPNSCQTQPSAPPSSLWKSHLLFTSVSNSKAEGRAWELNCFLIRSQHWTGDPAGAAGCEALPGGTLSTAIAFCLPGPMGPMVLPRDPVTAHPVPGWLVGQLWVEHVGLWSCMGIRVYISRLFLGGGASACCVCASGLLGCLCFSGYVCGV